MALDSAATFDERVNELGLGAHLAHFNSVGWYTYANLAHDTDYAPNGDIALFNEQVVKKGLGAIDHALRGTPRRLFFEAYTFASADLKRKLETGPDDPPRIIPSAEKLARRKQCAAKLPGLSLKGELDISDALLERAISMYDSNSLSYLSLDMCTKKENALLGVKKDRRWEHIPNAYGKLELRRVDDDARLNVDSQFAFIFALQRRALALQMGDVMDFSLCEQMRAKLIDTLMKPAPTGFLPVGMNQVLEADFVFWTQMV